MIVEWLSPRGRAGELAAKSPYRLISGRTSKHASPNFFKDIFSDKKICLSLIIGLRMQALLHLKNRFFFVYRIFLDTLEFLNIKFNDHAFEFFFSNIQIDHSFIIIFLIRKARRDFFLFFYFLLK